MAAKLGIQKRKKLKPDAAPTIFERNKQHAARSCPWITMYIHIYTHTEVLSKNKYGFNEYLRQPNSRWIFYVIISTSVVSLDMSCFIIPALPTSLFV